MAVPINLQSAEGAPTVGTPVPLFSSHLAGVAFPKQNYAVAADGQRFLMNVVDPDATTTPITITVNWLASLKR